VVVVAVAVVADSMPGNQHLATEDKPMLVYTQDKMVGTTPVMAVVAVVAVADGLGVTEVLCQAAVGRLRTVVDLQDRLGLAVRLPKIRLESTPVGLEISTTQVA
jgi:hypothetical protein